MQKDFFGQLKLLFLLFTVFIFNEGLKLFRHQSILQVETCEPSQWRYIINRSLMFSRQEEEDRPVLRQVFDRLDIRAFTQALRSYSAHCLFARENGTAPEGLSNDISLGFVFGAGYGRERESEAVYALILRRYRSFTRLAVLGDTRADKTTRARWQRRKTRREMKSFLSFFIGITTTERTVYAFHVRRHTS